LREKIFWLLAFALRLGGLAAWRDKIFWLLAFALRLCGLARKNLLAFSLRFETWRLGEKKSFGF